LHRLRGAAAHPAYAVLWILILFGDEALLWFFTIKECVLLGQPAFTDPQIAGASHSCHFTNATIVYDSV
jgi:hypothetical protein